MPTSAPPRRHTQRSSSIDLSALVADISHAGYRVVDDEPVEGFNRVFVYDPFGNRIELMEPVQS